MKWKKTLKDIDVTIRSMRARGLLGTSSSFDKDAILFTNIFRYFADILIFIQSEDSLQEERPYHFLALLNVIKHEGL